MNIVDSLSDEDKQLLIRYVKTCRNLAGYSVINTKNGLEMSWGRGGAGSTVRVDLPSHEEFSGFSATFRQLHNDGEAASFNKAWKIVNTAVNAAGLEESTLAARATLKAWKQARARLMEKAAATLIAEKLNPNLKPEHPRPLKGIVPEDLIRQFNYGDTLHWGDQREKLAALNDGDPLHASYYKYCCESTMTSLAHLYFGFALLVAAALGVPDLGQG
uniref:hypothetical protein n=1 Tax=Gordonia sp. B7-2 TaxID=3420932 RepID=UPI003D8A4609